MAITTMDGLVAAIAAAQYIDTEEASKTAKASGWFTSLWQAGGRPGSGVSPGSASGVVCTSATVGAMPLVDAGGGNTNYLARLEVSSSVAESVILYDRLVHSDSLSGTSTSSQTVGTPSLTRFTSGAGVGIWIEWYTATGSTGVTATVKYTNQAGTSGQSTTVAFPASPLAGSMIPVPLASGDSGVQAVASVQLSATTGTAGSFGITLCQRIVTVPLPLANLGVSYDYAGLGLPDIAPAACLTYKVLCTTTSTGQIISGLTIVQG